MGKSKRKSDTNSFSSAGPAGLLLTGKRPIAQTYQHEVYLERRDIGFYLVCCSRQSGFVYWDYLFSHIPPTREEVNNLEDRYMSYLRRKQNSEPSVARAAVPCDPGAKATYPALFEYLTSCEGPDGEVRETATLLVFVSEGLYRACLNDRHTASHLWAVASALDELFAAVEERLTSDSPDWRAVRQNGTTDRRKK